MVRKKIYHTKAELKAAKAVWDKRYINKDPHTYREKNIERVRRYKKTIRGRTKERIYSSKRRALVKKQTPKWNNTKLTEKIFKIAVEIEKKTGLKMHVAHLVPLKGYSYEDKAPISGLNVWYNLLPLPYNINLKQWTKCFPVDPDKTYPFEHFSLNTLPKPKNWMKFVEDQKNQFLEDMEGANYEESIKYTEKIIKQRWKK